VPGVKVVEVLLFRATLLFDLTAMVVCLWMAFYLLARGFPSRITLRAVILLLALSAFFFGAYNNLFEQIPGTAAWRAAFLIIGFSTWYEITHYLLPKNTRQRRLPWIVAIYIFGFTTIVLLLGTGNAFVGEQGNVLYVARMGVGYPYVLYAIFQITVLAGILYNLLGHDRVGFTPAGRYFLLASLFVAAGVVYAILSLALSPEPLPRLIQDLAVFCGVFMLGISVARHQSLIERRTSLQDLPATCLTVLLLTSAYILAALRFGVTLKLIGTLAAFVVISHALFDLVREFLERLRIRNESTFRKQLSQLANKNSEDTLRLRLQQGLDLLCLKLNASGGFIAVKREEEFLVTVSRHSVGTDKRYPASVLSCEDVTAVQNGALPDVHYLAPSFDGQTQIAVLGIGRPNTRSEYSYEDLDFLAEVADKVGTVVLLSSAQAQISQLLSQSKINENEAGEVASRMLGAMEINPDQEFIRMVEENLRNLWDYIKLGQSPLADKLCVQGDSHIERGRKVQTIIIEAIELLRPAQKRPSQPLPRVWYNHAVLHDAYVEGVPNREIMARLYISEGTFNRTRRIAIRGLARLLMEKYPAA
jgi:hypothetical protein